MLIEDGKGQNGAASVSGSQRMNVSAKTARRLFYASRDDGLSFVAVYDGITAAAGDHVMYLKNTSTTRDMMIDFISLSAVEAVKWKMFEVTGTAAAGETVTASVLKLASGRTVEATIMAGNTTITGLTTGNQIVSRRSVATGTLEIDYESALILAPTKAIVIEYDTGTTGLCEGEICFHYEALGWY